MARVAGVSTPTDDGSLRGVRILAAARTAIVVVSAGAGFVVALLGDILRMPGLPAKPQALEIDLKGGVPQGLMAG